MDQVFSTREMMRATGMTANQIGLIVTRIGFPRSAIQGSRQARKFSLRDLFWMALMARLARFGMEWSKAPLILENFGLYNEADADWLEKGELFPGAFGYAERGERAFLAAWVGNPSDGPSSMWNNQRPDLIARIASFDEVSRWIGGYRAAADRRNQTDFAAVSIIDLAEAENAVRLAALLA